MKDRVDAVFGTEDKIPIPEPLFGFTLKGSHEKSKTQLRQMIARDHRLSSPLDDFESKLKNVLREHCNITGKDYNSMLKVAMKGYEALFDNEKGRMNLIIERVESGHEDIAAWDAKWIGPPPLVASGNLDNDLKIVPVAPARICLVANMDRYDVELREAFETVLGNSWEEIAYANPFYIVSRTVTIEGNKSVHYPVSILNDVMAVALNLKPLHHAWE